METTYQKQTNSNTQLDSILVYQSIGLVISEKIIDQVINHQFDSANDALNTNDTLEISGFGKFFFNTKKANTHYNKLLAMKQAYENTLALSYKLLIFKFQHQVTKGYKKSNTIEIYTCLIL